MLRCGRDVTKTGYRRLLARDGQFMTGAIPGGGIATNVRLVEVATILLPASEIAS